MPVLTSDLRRQLENVIIAARDQAESAALSALQKRGVDVAKPHEHFGPAEKALRNQLRARGRQAGDKRNADGSQEIEQLTQELAYEYWHRMLFARFLAENHLLMHPDGVAVSLDECNELAAGEKAANGFVLAARYASRMLPQIFRTDDVLLEIEFPANDRLPLEKLLASLPSQTFTADDSLGWVYQFWQSKRKDEVNAKGDKIDAKSISAVTQLFTEHYMVLFLLHNTVGAWHAGKVLAANPSLAQSPTSEDDLRKAVALKSEGGYGFEYLRFVKTDDSTWRPAAGTFDGWPKHARELKTLDPCCGSGHFLVALFELLVRLRMDEEGLTVGEAVDAVLRDNLHGLELDPRCTQIAAFNLAIAAWKLGGYRPLPPLNIACTGIGPQGKKDDWLKLADDAPLRDRGPIRLGLGALYDTFTDAPTLGSLIDPSSAPRPAGAADFETLAPILSIALRTDAPLTDNRALDHQADAITAQGLLKAAELLAGPDGGYSLIMTNVPYLKRGNQSDILADYAISTFPEAKADLAVMFLERCWDCAAPYGTVAAVIQHNFLFQDYYKAFRHRLLNRIGINLLSRLGAHAFETISGEVVSVCLLIAQAAPQEAGVTSTGIDASHGDTPPAKVKELRTGPVSSFNQMAMLKNPGFRVSFAGESTSERLGNYASHSRGISSGDDARFCRFLPEIASVTAGWSYCQNSCRETQAFGGCEEIFYWQDGAGAFSEFVAERLGVEQMGQWIRGRSAWGNMGVAITATGQINSTLYLGNLFHQNVIVITPNSDADLTAIWSCCSDPNYGTEVRKLDQSLKAGNAVVQVPFDFANWHAVAAEKYPNGLPEPESDDPTQWLFHGRPEASEEPLLVAVARLAGYRWPSELDKTMRLSERARTLVKRSGELLKFADDDGVLPISAMRGEPPLHERVTEILTATYGKAWSAATLHKLLADCGMRAGASLDEWLREKFFEQHCKLFHHRPFIWHIWDGRKDGFGVLVNYHKLDHKLLESLTHAYLGDWISTQRSDAKNNVTGADLRLEAAEALQDKLEKIIEGEKPYDIFIRWKPLKDQPIGWRPDLNDGVRMNIRPFVEADVLRKTPNIKWTKDRGKDPESAPWYKKFGGERINDHHLSLEEKRKAKGR